MGHAFEKSAGATGHWDHWETEAAEPGSPAISPENSGPRGYSDSMLCKVKTNDVITSFCLAVGRDGFPDGSVVKNLPVMQETQLWSLGQEDPLEKGMATYFSILAWRIPWTEEPGGYSPWGHRELDTMED